MSKKWMPITVGILDLVGGTIQVLIFVSLLAYSVSGIVSRRIYGDAVGLAVLLLIITAPLVAAGILAIVGGYNALKEQRLGLVYMGSVTAFLPLLLSLWICSTKVTFDREWLLAVPIVILGVAPIVLTAVSRKQFVGY